jgi:hypothetical protein
MTSSTTWRRCANWICPDAAGAVLVAVVALSAADARAQDPEVAWYRTVNFGSNPKATVPLTAGTMPAYQRVGEGYSGTFPFRDTLEISVRPKGDVTEVKVVDGTSVVRAVVSCTGAGLPRHTALWSNSTIPDSPVIMIDVVCSAVEPAVR